MSWLNAFNRAFQNADHLSCLASSMTHNEIVSVKVSVEETEKVLNKIEIYLRLLAAADLIKIIKHSSAKEIQTKLLWKFVNHDNYQNKQKN